MVSFHVAALAVLLRCANSVDTCEGDGDATSLIQGLGVVRQRIESEPIAVEATTEPPAAGPLPAGSYQLLHTNGICGEVQLDYPPQISSGVPLCALRCAAQEGCRYFALPRTRSAQEASDRSYCLTYHDCPAYDAAEGEQHDWHIRTSMLTYHEASNYDAWEMIQPGSEDSEPTTPETIIERWAREHAQAWEFTCSQNRVTPGTCQYLGCWGWRGDTECVEGQCVCSPGGCSNTEGKCVSANEFVNQ